jgi:uracil-DNA glycosylase
VKPAGNTNVMVMAPTCGAPQEARVRVIVALGAFVWDAALRTIASGGATPIRRPRPKFGHGTEAVAGSYELIASFHPSERNTFTGRLSAPMLEAVLRRAGALARD